MANDIYRFLVESDADFPHSLTKLTEMGYKIIKVENYSKLNKDNKELE